MPSCIVQGCPRSDWGGFPEPLVWLGIPQSESLRDSLDVGPMCVLSSSESSGPQGELRRTIHAGLGRSTVTQEVLERQHDAFGTPRPHRVLAKEPDREIGHHEQFLFARKTSVDEGIGIRIIHSDQVPTRLVATRWYALLSGLWSRSTTARSARRVMWAPPSPAGRRSCVSARPVPARRSWRWVASSRTGSRWFRCGRGPGRLAWA